LWVDKEPEQILVQRVQRVQLEERVPRVQEAPLVFLVQLVILAPLDLPAELDKQALLAPLATRVILARLDLPVELAQLVNEVTRAIQVILARLVQLDQMDIEAKPAQLVTQAIPAQLDHKAQREHSAHAELLVILDTLDIRVQPVLLDATVYEVIRATRVHKVQMAPTESKENADREV
jgi:hypothetical protein